MVLVMELAVHGSLDSVLLQHAGSTALQVTPAEHAMCEALYLHGWSMALLQVKLAMATQVSSGMVAMHTEGLIHRV